MSVVFAVFVRVIPFLQRIDIIAWVLGVEGLNTTRLPNTRLALDGQFPLSLQTRNIMGGYHSWLAYRSFWRLDAGRFLPFERLVGSSLGRTFG
jgi:hypothetical protein